MKKLVCICALAVLCVLSAAARDNYQVFSQLCKAAKEADRIEGVESVKIGGLLMKLAKAAAMNEAKMEKSAKEDDDDLEMSAEMLKNLSAILMVDYEEASARDKAEITRRFEEILSGHDLIMEANDEGERVRMYGKVDEQNGTVEDMVFFEAADGALVAFCGKMALAEAMNMAND